MLTPLRTVKPIAVMRWLCRLVTPPGGLVLDPFAGSGTTVCAAMLEGFDAIGIEREAEYAEIARARVAHWRDPDPSAAAKTEPNAGASGNLGPRHGEITYPPINGGNLVARDARDDEPAEVAEPMTLPGFGGDGHSHGD